MEYRLQYLRPEEIAAAKNASEIVYVPIGPLEWHGPHNPIGLDALNAEKVALETASRIGGIVAPTLFLGTEVKRDPDFLKLLKFTGKEDIIGMDFPGLPLKSGYIEPDSFLNSVKSFVQSLINLGFKKIVLVNGHGAVDQVSSLNEICNTPYPDIKIVYFFSLLDMSELNATQGHATKLETSIMMSIAPDRVKLENLPSKKIEPKLSTQKYGMMDTMDSYERQDDDSIVCDPRDASVELGNRHLEKAVAALTELIKREF